MTEQPTGHPSASWIFAALSALLGASTLFDAHAGINWGIWVALTTLAALYCQRSEDFRRARPSTLLALAAILAAGADARTANSGAHVGIFCLTAFILGVFICSIRATDADEVRLLTLLTSPFLAVASVAVSAARKIGSLLQPAPGSSSRTAVRRTVLVAPVVLVIIALLAGADPVIHSTVESVTTWIPEVMMPARVIFFLVLLFVTLGAFSRLPDLKLALPLQGAQLRGGPTAADATVLVGSTLATLALFLILQVVYLFVHLPNQIGNGVTYAEYARRGFGELCVVVTIVAAVILFAEKLRRNNEGTRSALLRNLEFGSLVAAGLILLSALRRVVLYEQAYGYTVARVHATAYIVFIAGCLILLADQLRRGSITPALARRSAAFGLIVVLAILYWNDQAWITNRNIDRIRETGKFDVKYAASLSDDALPTIARRKNEIAPADWIALRDRLACKRLPESDEWYEWNAARAAARTARASLRLAASTACPKRGD
ncbi:MAG: DUF4173 domain-containing protein [Gemmatimonadaceae bacterium]|nr:DUF4173 domain-containing protein [Gemmatimonadaceae bacterium]